MPYNRIEKQWKRHSSSDGTVILRIPFLINASHVTWRGVRNDLAGASDEAETTSLGSATGADATGACGAVVTLAVAAGTNAEAGAAGAVVTKVDAAVTVVTLAAGTSAGAGATGACGAVVTAAVAAGTSAEAGAAATVAKRADAAGTFATLTAGTNAGAGTVGARATGTRAVGAGTSLAGFDAAVTGVVKPGATGTGSVAFWVSVFTAPVPQRGGGSVCISAMMGSGCQSPTTNSIGDLSND